MNVVREINRINEKELELATGAGSWHDQYKESAYIFVGGLNYELTEGDVITVFSQYGEIVDIDMPRDKATGKRRGFAFLMYEDQRSTVLAVDNLNGAELLGRTLRVDHTLNYKQKELVDGKWVDRETERLNVKPQAIEDNRDEPESDSASSLASVDKEDPMRDYLLAQKREKEQASSAGKRIKSDKKSTKKKHREGETPEERRARKERKKAKKLLLKQGEDGERRMIESRPITDRHRDEERDGRRYDRDEDNDKDGAVRNRSSSSPPQRHAERRSRSASPTRRSTQRRNGHSRSRTPTYRSSRDDRGSHGRDSRKSYE
ncbi:hypothetical protein FRC17_007117 [Serendipita sp. 399]|nr:hypothetical protein FRC17_007117 [Serendipita sp. 399]